MRGMTELSKAFLIYVPPHHDQYYRPYETHMDGRAFNNLMTITEGGQFLGSNVLAPIASDIISPAATPAARVNIANGFQEPRLAFFLEISSRNNGPYGWTEREIISGFTSHVGVSPQGFIDPTMVFYVNSRTVIRDDIRTNHLGTHQYAAVEHSAQVIGAQPHSGLATMRPEDVVAMNQTQTLFGTGDTNLYDGRWNLGVNTISSDRMNTIPSQYLSKILNGYVAADAESSVHDSQENIFKEAMSRVRTESFAISNFVSDMGLASPQRQHMFTFQELNERFPRNVDFWQKILPRPGSRPMSFLENTETWNGALVETQIAYALSHALPAIMSKLMMVEVEMDVTNMTLDGTTAVALIDAKGMFDGILSPQKLEYFKQQFHTEICRGVIGQKVGSYHVKMKVNLLSNSTFQISANGGPYVPFCAPMFCESYYSPIIGDPTHLSMISGAVDQIVTRMCTARGSFDPTVDVTKVGGGPSVRHAQSALFGNGEMIDTTRHVSVADIKVPGVNQGAPAPQAFDPTKIKIPGR